jgi:hypothetical protein
LEDQIESDSSELKKLKTEENSLIRMTTVKKEKLATARFKINKKQEDVKHYKQAMIEYEPFQCGAEGAARKAHRPSKPLCFLYHPLIHPSILPSIHLSISLFLCFYLICLSVYLSIYLICLFSF